MNNSSRLLGSLMLAPLLGATGSFAQATCMVIIMLLSWALYGSLSQTLRPLNSPNIRWISAVFLAATIVSCVELVLQALALELYQTLGIYPALISLQCLLFDRAGMFERSRLRENLNAAAAFCVLLLIVGFIRETLGNGTLFSQLHGLAPQWEIHMTRDGHGWRLLTLAPGAFILLGLLIAAKRAWANRSRSL